MRLILGLTLAITACAPAPADPAPRPAGPGVERACSAEGLGDLLGRGASSALGSEAMRRSGAGAIRWIRPGDS
jgi:hypothetical protein